MEKFTKFRLGVAAAALTGCGFGAVALGPVFAGAQESDDTTTTVPAEEGATDEVPAGEDCGPGGRFPGLRGGFEAAAEAIGIEPSALREALQEDDQTIAEVAEANGVDPADVIAAMVADAQERIAAAVAEGRITQEQADERLADLEQRMTDIVNGEFEFPRGGPGHGRGPRGERPADDVPAEEDDGTS